MFFLSGCANKVITFTNDASRFGAYQTYTIVNFKSSNNEVSETGSQVMNAIQMFIGDQMARRAYTPDGNDPDLLVRYELISNQVVETSVNNNPYFRSSYYYPDRYFRMRTFLESALLIEIKDLTSNKLVWQGSVDLNKYNKKKNNQEILEKAINEIFNTYLYRAGSKMPDESLIVESK